MTLSLRKNTSKIWRTESISQSLIYHKQIKILSLIYPKPIYMIALIFSQRENISCWLWVAEIAILNKL